MLRGYPKELRVTGVYAIVHSVLGVLYIGASKRSVANRVAWHRAILRQGKHKATEMQRIWDRDGEDLFEPRILEECAPDLCLERERYWVAQYPDILNNRPPGRYRHTIETRMKMSEGRARWLDKPGSRQQLSERARRQWAEGKGPVQSARRYP